MSPHLSLPLTLALVVMSACGAANYQFETNAPAYAGRAKVRITAEETGNGQLTIQLEHLAPPNKIDPDLLAYVVWQKVEGREPAKLGVLTYDAKRRTGKLTATYSATAMQLIVSVEKDPATNVLTGAKVLDVNLVPPRKKS